MSSSVQARTAFNAGDLQAAIDAASADIKARPADPAPRLLLGELLLFRGTFDRVETLLAALATLSPDLALVVAEFRQLLRAEIARGQVLAEGGVPSFLGEPTPSQQRALQALVALRAGDAAEAAGFARAAEEKRPRVSGRHSVGGETTGFDDFRDADDVLGGTIEVLTTTGVYYWVPLERIDTLQFHAPKRPRDLFWRRASIAVQGGPDGDVYVPSCYRAAPDATDAILLGRATDWTEAEPVRGAGQRVFLAGEEALPINGIDLLTFGAG
ncbi:SciE type virulence protein [Acetobacteraceae bacterium KSS8]|uniref:SciE type virulence protein n=1 Tax=Endosaccharibacter trunci TaxID=2812733 RepID=A0ABT1W6Y1_9PROT|nr:SciE type virulence protein [Acetobacteraceae bacterium KSS8]